MTTIRQLCDNDPAVAIEHMINGLLNHREIKDFKLDFGCSSKWANGVCAGGSVTVTLIQILDMSFAPPQLNNDFARADLMQTDMRDLLDFEEAIDLFSQGSLVAIEKYFDLPTSRATALPWCLHNEGWEGELPEVINFWEQLTGRRYDMTTVALEYRWTKAAAAAWSNMATYVL
jgi:hypothetical protein